MGHETAMGILEKSGVFETTSFWEKATTELIKSSLQAHLIAPVYIIRCPPLGLKRVW